MDKGQGLQNGTRQSEASSGLSGGRFLQTETKNTQIRAEHANQEDSPVGSGRVAHGQFQRGLGRGEGIQI